MQLGGKYGSSKSHQRFRHFYGEHAIIVCQQGTTYVGRRYKSKQLVSFVEVKLKQWRIYSRRAHLQEMFRHWSRARSINVAMTLRTSSSSFNTYSTCWKVKTWTDGQPWHGPYGTQETSFTLTTFNLSHNLYWREPQIC